jgi:RNA polymerase sigma-70 factor (ECF subfamily)
MTVRSKSALERSLAHYDDTADVAVDAVMLAKVEHAMQRLSRRQREIFLAIRFDNLGYPEIAKRTGLTVAQVERLFAAALINFMRNLDDTRRHWWRRWP